MEGFVLGLFWQFGESSPYDIRQIMIDSPSTQWSASTGAIYPLIRRLEGLGLLQGKADRGDKRRRRTYAITARGMTRLRGWLGPPIAQEAVSVVFDPLRTRGRFIQALPPAARAAWVRASLEALDEVEARVRRWEDKYGVRGQAALHMLTRHAEIDLQGRRAWLKELEGAVSGAKVGKAGAARAGVGKRRARG